MKDRIEELQIDKNRLEELKEENSILIETRTLIEKQINDYQVRLLGIQRLDADLNKYKQEIDALNKQAEVDNKRMCSLCEKNAKLEIEIKNLLNQNVSADEELNYYKQKFTFTSAELSKQQSSFTTLQQTVQTQSTQLNIKQSEYDLQINDLNEQLQQRNKDLGHLKDSLRVKETALNESLAKIRVLNEQLNLEHENKLKSERCLDQHKLEIRELQLRLDDCVNETKKLDKSIRAAAQTNELKETETEESLKNLVETNDKLSQSFRKLSTDHDELQKIYIQLENDYDEMYQELNKKHSDMNQMNGEMDQLKDKYTASLIMIDDLETNLRRFTTRQVMEAACNTVQTICEKEQQFKEIETKYEIKLNALNQEIIQLTLKKEQSESELKKISFDLNQISSENKSLKTENKNIQNEFEKHQDKFQQQFMQTSQLSEKIQVFIK